MKLFLVGLGRRSGRPMPAPRQRSDGTPFAREALHDLALGVVREQAAVAGEIGRDLALGAPLLGRDDAVEDPAPERLALTLSAASAAGAATLSWE